ncbi:MAG: hypothetical protein PUK24_03490 [Elusimicrobia bacterium]|nr:hypothetical protein [Elusimicrobiota bacterium]MDY6039471.1 hypothetical protein [Elusimicrobiaceae bacterium]
MKKLSLVFLAAFLCACSSMIPYKNQNLDYLHGIEQNPDAYRGKVVSFGGEVKGVTEDARRMRLVIKIDVPFYYYATGKDPLSYQLLLISFDKKGMPQMTGIQKGSDVKVLARVANYETRKNLTGKPIAVLHLIAFALADRDRDRDFFRPEPPYKQLYESWKAGRLFFNEQPQEIEARHPAIQRKTMTFFPLPPRTEEEKPAPAKGIVYDEEEPAFVLPPDPKPEPQREPQAAGETEDDTPTEMADGDAADTPASADASTLQTPASAATAAETPTGQEQPLPAETSPAATEQQPTENGLPTNPANDSAQMTENEQTDAQTPAAPILKPTQQEVPVSPEETPQMALPSETASTEETTPQTVVPQKTSAEPADESAAATPDTPDNTSETIQ